MPSQLFQTIDFTPPKNWEDASVISFVNPAAGDFQANIVAAKHDIGSDSLADYASAQSSEFAAEVIEYELLQSREHKIGDNPAYTLEHVFLADDPVRIHQLILFVARGAEVFSLSCTHSSEEFEAHREVFEEAIASFQLR